MRRLLSFAGRVTVAHVVTYLGVGILAYAFVTRTLFDSPSGLVAQVMRTPAEPVLWNHVIRWMLPLQILRGILIALVLYPFLATFRSWGYAKRVAAIAGLYVVLGQWASTVAGSGTIEGWLILRPEFTSPDIVIRAMIEGFVQGLALAAWVARSMMPVDSGLKQSPLAGNDAPDRVNN